MMYKVLVVGTLSASAVLRMLIAEEPNGMGVGLSVSRSIVEDHGGQLRAQSNLGHCYNLVFSVLVRGDVTSPAKARLESQSVPSADGIML